MRETQLVIMHAAKGEIDDWARFPPVRKTLERWGVLAPDSPRSAVFEKLSMRVAKVTMRGDPVRASASYINRQKPDLIVLATRGRHGLPLWLKPSIAQAIARRSDAMTLFVPSGCRGIVSLDGFTGLHRILIPVDHEPHAQEAVIRAVRAAEAFGDDTVEIVLLHVNGRAVPRLHRPQIAACVWQEVRRAGDVVSVILDVAQSADLIVMATAGRQGFLEGMRGSVTERVIRGAPCPVLAVPAR
jgi:nucleotide-binding universal stress UspA family protein